MSSIPPEGRHQGPHSAVACCHWHPPLEELAASPETQPSLFCCGELLDAEWSPTFSPSTINCSFHNQEKRCSYLFSDHLWISGPSFYQVALIIEVTKCELHPVRHLNANWYLWTPQLSRGFLRMKTEHLSLCRWSWISQTRCGNIHLGKISHSTTLYCGAGLFGFFFTMMKQFCHFPHWPWKVHCKKSVTA